MKKIHITESQLQYCLKKINEAKNIEENASQCFTKKQIKEAKLRKMKDESTVITKGEIKRNLNK